MAHRRTKVGHVCDSQLRTLSDTLPVLFGCRLGTEIQNDAAVSYVEFHLLHAQRGVLHAATEMLLVPADSYMSLAENGQQAAIECLQSFNEVAVVKSALVDAPAVGLA